MIRTEMTNKQKQMKTKESEKEYNLKKVMGIITML